jgi:2-methylcitrate dehydratase PrpD
MELEKRLAEYASEVKFEDLPEEPVGVAKNVTLTVLGTTVAGATAEGCETLVNQAKEWGGREEATILIYGGKVPAHNAALVNSVMARALDFCDGMIPGMHVGSSSVPTALATAELIGGCSGKDFLTALVVGSEVAARLNLSESAYDGFDPTGVCSIFAAAAIAGRIMHLSPKQMLDALALAFNRSGGSFQSNVDGSLAVRLIQGFVSQAGIICAQLAQKGFNGPKNFLGGVYGYFHLYAKDRYDAQAVVGELGERFEMTKVLFKKYPSCGGTLSSTDAILEIMREKELIPENVVQIDIKVVPYIYRLVGHPFKIGENPKVDAQFSIQYCVANALLRRSAKLKHFDEPYIMDPKIMGLIKKIHITPDPLLEERGHTALEMRVMTRDGSIYHKSVDIARGFPKNPLTKEEHNERFQDCMNYSGKPLPPENIKKIVSLVNSLEEVKDVRSLIPLLLTGKCPASPAL